MMNLLSLWVDEVGQDVVEYSLLLAFMVVLSAAFLIMNRDSINSIWTSADNTLAAGNTAAS